jgi:DNA-binding IclR family transcriptional regulator
MDKNIASAHARGAAARDRPSAAGTPRAVRVRQVPAVSRAIAILRLLGRSEAPLPLKAIAQDLGLVPSTCLHILRVLVAEGLVAVDADSKRYRPGIGLVSLARNALQGAAFPGLAQPVLDRVSARWGVTAVGVGISGLEHMVALALSRSSEPFSLHVDVGSRFPALISATGRLVAAYTDEPWSAVERRFRSLRWDRPPSFAAWTRDVQAARRRGYSIDRGHYIAGVIVVAVPVLDGRGRMTHGLIAVGMADRLPAARRLELAHALAAEAQTLSQRLESSV